MPVVVAIHRTDSGSWSFQENGAGETLLIEAPTGSELLPTPGLRERARLFVPCGRGLRLGHDAAEVMRAVRERRGAFRVV